MLVTYLQTSEHVDDSRSPLLRSPARAIDTPLIFATRPFYIDKRLCVARLLYVPLYIKEVRTSVRLLCVCTSCRDVPIMTER